ncbi:hypothetical protein HDV00_006181 [Rhizophlyctis rosea]|nr:hypothetical protein HDV00_006181 [Rhizophlyctis rosea]
MAEQDDPTSLTSLKDGIQTIKTARIQFLEAVIYRVQLMGGESAVGAHDRWKSFNAAFGDLVRECLRWERLIEAALQSETRIDPDEWKPSPSTTTQPADYSGIIHQITTIDHQLQVIKLKLIMSAQHMKDGEALQSLLDDSAPFGSIKADLQALVLDWETCYQKLEHTAHPGSRDVAPVAPEMRPDTHTTPSEPAETFRADQDLEYEVTPSAGPEDVYEDYASPEVARKASKLSRDERIKQQKMKREAEPKSKWCMS